MTHNPLQCNDGCADLWAFLRRLFVILIAVVSILMLVANLRAASPFYEFKIIAKTGDSVDGFSISSFKPNPSINDNGRVVFIAANATGGKAVFVAEPSGNTHVLTKLADTSSGDYDSVSINNRDEVASQFRLLANGVTIANIRRYSPSGPGGAYVSTNIAKATTARQIVTVDPCFPFASCRFTQRFRLEAFDDIVGQISINDSGAVAYTALALLDTGQRYYFLTAQTQYPPTKDPFDVKPYQLFSTLPDFQPVIANSGEIVAQVGNRSDAPILLYSSSLDLPQVIAGAASFTELGKSPGLSDDGQVVAFYGNLKPEKTKQITVQNGDVVPFPITPGPGIFASVRFGTNGQRYLVRVAGAAGIGQLDPGELLQLQLDGTLRDRGQDFAFRGNYSSSLTWEIQSFSTKTPIAVSGSQPFSNTTSGSAVTIVYLATDTAGRLGLYSSRVNLFNPQGAQSTTIGVEAPILVARNTDILTDSAANTPFTPISDLAINKSINTDGVLTFWASAGNVQALFTATPFTSFAAAAIDQPAKSAKPVSRSSLASPPPKPCIYFQIESPIAQYLKGGCSFQDRESEASISQIILHASGGDESSLLKTVTGDEVSIHYTVSAEGRITQVIPEEKAAFHAVNCAGSDQHLSNRRSIGIELVDNNRSYHRGWPSNIQLERTAKLVRDIALRKGIYEELSGKKRIVHPAVVPYRDFRIGGSDANRAGYKDGMRMRDTPFSHAPWIAANGFETLPRFLPASAGLVWLPYISDPKSCNHSYTSTTSSELLYSDGYDHSTRGVIAHGQVLDRTRGRSDPGWFDWPAFMTMVNRGLTVTLSGPDLAHVYLLVTDSFGRRAGAVPQTGHPLTEIPGSTYSGRGTSPQVLAVPEIEEGQYVVQVIGDVGPSWRYELVSHLSSKDSLKTIRTAGVTPAQVSPAPFQTASGAGLSNAVSYTLNYDSIHSHQTKFFAITNLPPSAEEDFAFTSSNSAVAINVLANDVDPDGFLDTNSVIIVTNPPNGTVTVDATTRIITYTPANGFLGTNNFVYTMRDNQGALSAPGFVTVIITEPPITSNTAPITIPDFAATTNGRPATIYVLANDSAPDGTLVPQSLTLTSHPTNGTANVGRFTGVITYIPNPGATNVDAFRYTVRDDLGTLSAEAVVIITNLVTPGARQTSPSYYVEQLSSSGRDQRYPRINNHGDVVWQERINGNWQIVASDGRGQITFPDGSYGDSTSPGISDDGQIICSRQQTNANATVHGTSILDYTFLYPSYRVALTNPFPTIECSPSSLINNLRTETSRCRSEPSLSSDGRTVIGAQYDLFTLSQDNHRSWLYVGGAVAVESNPTTQYDHPDANAQGDFTFLRGNQVFFNNQFRQNAVAASLSDTPKEKPDIVFSNGDSLYSSILGKLDSGNPGEMAGSWVDVNRSGVIVFEKQIGGSYQVFKAWPLEPRILSTLATNALVGFPWQADADNIVEAYGGEPEADDPREIKPLTWSCENPPAGFSINPTNGLVAWAPQAAGEFTFTIVARSDSEILGIREDRLPVTVHVRQSAFEPLVDAVDFRNGNSPDLLTDPTEYFTRGQERVGVVADGVSRLILRVKLEGVNAVTAQALHFVIAVTNATPGRDGSLLAFGSTNRSIDVPATLVNVGGTNKAICVFEAPLDYDAASEWVTVQLRYANQVIATQTIQLSRPPIVLVHDGWNRPSTWHVAFDKFIELGVDIHLFDYGLVAGTNPAAISDLLFFKTSEAIAARRLAGYASSQVDMVAHGSGALIARLHAQRYSMQASNYHRGDVHKLITVGGAHGGSYLATLISSLKTTNGVAYTNLRNAALVLSEATGEFPPVDLNHGLIDDLRPGSPTLVDLEEIHVPGHAIATSGSVPPLGSILTFLNGFFGVESTDGLTSVWDGFVTVQSASGGIASNATTLLPGIAHSALRRR